jgi:threonine dehydrogenase-like Zn-dependent dehydrogenase
VHDDVGGAAMKAIVFEAIGRVALEERPEPRILSPGDALVRVTAAGICGSDLHIVDGRDAGIRLGTIMGHELVGAVEETGAGVSGISPGDRVVSPFSTSCGSCFFCARGLTARCVKSECLGVVAENGRGLEGAQATLVRVPLAGSTLVKLPATKSDGSELRDEEAILLGDVLSTAWLAAERAEVRRDDVVAVIGCGPVGLLAVLSALRLGAAAVVAVDAIAYRRERAHAIGAHPCPADPALARAAVDDLTEGRGADAVVEAVGSAQALDLAMHVARVGAVVSVAGYHTEAAYPLPMPAAYSKNLSFRFGRASARAQIERLLPLLLDGSLAPASIVTHRLPISDGVRAYEIFRRREDGAIKVLLLPGQ